MTRITSQTEAVVVELEDCMFAAEALKRAAYVMMGRATINFEKVGQKFRCRLTALAPSDDLEGLTRDFHREVLDQDLRLTIQAETEPLRSAILGLAFSKTGLQE